VIVFRLLYLAKIFMQHSH